MEFEKNFVLSPRVSGALKAVKYAGKTFFHNIVGFMVQIDLNVW